MKVTRATPTAVHEKVFVKSNEMQVLPLQHISDSEKVEKSQTGVFL